MSGEAGPEPRVRACAETHTVELDGEVLIWDPRSEQLHRLNPTATRIWRELSTWRTSAEVSATMTVDAGVDSSRVARDVVQCVEQLAAAGLLERDGAA
jgi:hypothetical protein